MIDKHSSRTALLIDDEAYFRKFVGQVLRRELGSEVREAKDGREGILRFQEAPPDFVLLDINMPHMDGLRTLAALRQLSATVPIIMLTSASEEKIVDDCVGQGATFFIRKDVPAQELTVALREALHEFVYGPSA